MSIRVERNDTQIPNMKPITIWWTNHEWSDITIEEAEALFEALGDVLGRRAFALTDEQVMKIRAMGKDS